MSNLALPMAIEIEKHQSLINAIDGIPPIQGGSLRTNDQKEYLSQIKCKYSRIARYIDYRQRQDFGLDTPNPLSGNWGEKEVLKRLYQLLGDYYYEMLQMIIAGWRIIRDKAISEGLKPHSHPREMFADILQKHALQEFQPALSSGIAIGETLSEMRKAWQKEARLLRNYEKPHTPEVQKHLKDLQSSLWAGYWLYAIWDDRESPMFESPRATWREYRKSHKKIVAMLKERGEDANGFSHTAIQWNSGFAVSSEGKPVKWFDSVRNIS